MILTKGSKAPNFSLPDQNGKLTSLSEFLGKWVLLYFYPRDLTPGCTTEACSIRDLWDEFKKFNAIVLGVSTDSVKSHKKFETVHKLPFTILADEEKEVVKKYGVWGQKKFIGKTFDGTFRTSFLINPNGDIEKVYENVKPAEHATAVLADLKSLV